jgi:hypothetical protein
MPNWCNNFVSFFGKEEDLIKLQEVFSEMIKQEEITNEGQLPEFAKISEQLGLNRWFFGLYNNSDFCYTFETRWAPNTLNLVAIADHFNLEFESEYEEGGNLIYGKSFYKNKILEELDLDRSDLLQITWIEDTEEKDEYYLYQGEKYENDNEIKEIIWDKKFKS